MSRISVAAVACLALASGALAQAPAPADPTTTPTTAPTAVPAAPPAAAGASKCTKPDDHPGRLSSDRQRRGWEKEVQTWQTCMKKYVGEVQARADEAVKTANAAVAESNAAVAEYNNTIKAIQAQLDALK